MAKTYVLDRVAADLARGSTHPAIQRLSSLVAAYPNDLDLRRRLAAVHRRVGNRIQAGRWDYLTIGADAGDTHAFERAFPAASARLREVRWPHRAGQAATAYARNRLAKLVEAAEAERPDGGAERPDGRAVRPDGRAVHPGGRAVRPGGGSAAAAPAGKPAGAGSGWPTRSAILRAAAYSLRAGLPIRRVSAHYRRLERSSQITGILLAAAAVAAAALVLVGLITVVQWIVQ